MGIAHRYCKGRWLNQKMEGWLTDVCVLRGPRKAPEEWYGKCKPGVRGPPGGLDVVMFIHEMSENECRNALKRASFGRLACAHDNQPYVVPTYFASEGYHLYGCSTLGQKIEWMRGNPRVCVEIDEQASPDDWMSVIVFGHYEELPDTLENKVARARALELLQRRARWWEPAYVSASHRDSPHSSTPISYRIHIDKITGHRATPDKVEARTQVTDAASAKKSWLCNTRRWIENSVESDLK